MKRLILCLFLTLTIIGNCAQSGIASFYSIKSNGGTRTASGERLKDTELTAAHPSLPFNTKVKVTNISNNKECIVRINNRGPFATNSRGSAIFPLKPHPKRIIDVSVAAAEKLGFKQKGITEVKIEILQ